MPSAAEGGEDALDRLAVQLGARPGPPTSQGALRGQAEAYARVGRALLEAPPKLATFVQGAWGVVERGRPFLTNWHIDLLCEYLEAVHLGQIRRLVLNMPPRFGKPVDGNTLVLKADGTRTKIRDLAVGDKVISGRGRPQTVLATFAQPSLQCVEVTTFSGRSVVAALDHNFLTPEGWVEAGRLMVGQALALLPEIKIATETRHTMAEHRLAGYFIGDGSCTGGNASFTNADQTILADFLNCIEAMGFKARNAGRFLNYTTQKLSKAYSIRCRDGIRDWMQAINIKGKSSYTKTVPAFVFNSPNETMAHFLGAYFACDGYCTTSAHGRTDRKADICSMSRQLLEQTQHLLLRLGVQTSLRAKPVKYRDRVLEAWILRMLGQDDVSRFAARVPVYGYKNDLERLGAMRLRSLSAFQPTYNADRIVDIKAAGKRDCWCIQVAEDETYTVNDFVCHNSTLVTVAFPCWEWTMDPTLRFMFSSYAQTLCTKHSMDRRRVIQSDWYRKAWGELVVLAKDENLKQRFQNTATGHMITAPVGGTATGLGGNRLVIDDLLNPKKADSPLESETAIEHYRKTLRSRLDDASGAIIGVEQRLGPKDWTGTVTGPLPVPEGDEERGEEVVDGWTRVRVPIEAQLRTRYTFPLSGRVKVMERGELLDPRRRSKTDIEEMVHGQQGMGTRAASAQLYQRPASEDGQRFKRSWWRYIQECPPDVAMTIWVWDTAVKKNEAAAKTAGIRMALVPGTGVIFLDVVNDHMEYPELKRRVRQAYHGAPTDLILVEDKSSGQQLIQDLSNPDDGSVPLPVVATDPDFTKLEKVQRAALVEPKWETGQVYVLQDRQWVRGLIDEYAEFPDGTFKDQVDAGVHGVHRLLRQGVTTSEDDAEEGEDMTAG